MLMLQATLVRQSSLWPLYRTCTSLTCNPCASASIFARVSRSFCRSSSSASSVSYSCGQGPHVSISRLMTAIWL